MKPTTIAIVGLGLMGGSLAISLRQSGRDYRFIGLDHNPSHQEQAVRLGIVDEIAKDFQAALLCDIVILAIPVDAIISLLKPLRSLPKDTTLIDLGSTKAKISQALHENIRPHLVAAHPMTGTEKNGPSAAFGSLYKEKTVVVCDQEKSAPAHLEKALSLFEAVGSHVVFMEANQHDKDAAFISHMPHLISFSLANAVMSQEQPKDIIALAGGGFRDMSRIAKSHPTMWQEIFRQNADNLNLAIDAFEKELEVAKELIAKKDWEGLYSWMQKANSLHAILD